ncbi:MAG: uracil-DNA glycosylase family protein [Gammaproteobacteria bacterium]
MRDPDRTVDPSSPMSASAFDSLLESIRSCRQCEGLIPEPRPILRAHPEARLLIVGQAPGQAVHRTGIPWNDPSGKALREWMGIERAHFYDPTRVAILPAGFCYPGRSEHGDLPPRPECARLWKTPLLKSLPAIRLTLLLGRYAHLLYLPETRSQRLTDTVREAARWLPDYLPLPHPSPRNRLWLKRHLWFTEDILPLLRIRLRALWEEGARKCSPSAISQETPLFMPTGDPHP